VYEVIRNRARRTFRTLHVAAGDIRGQILNRRRPSRHPIVAIYHSISERATRGWGPWEYAITPKTFERQLSYFDRNYTVLSLDHFVKWLVDNEPIPRDSVVLTFDDAYRDFRTEALPLLENHGFPATVYISTALLGEGPQAPFEHRLGTALSGQKKLNITVGELSVDTRLRTREDVIDCYEYIRSNLKSSSPKQRDRFFEAVDVDLVSKDIILDSEELKQIHQHPLVTIGSHGHEHVPFTALSSEEQKANVEASRNHLKKVLTTPPRHFSFPYGSFNSSAIHAVENAGFESAVTTQSRPISSRDWGRPYTIPRIDAATKPIDCSMDIHFAD